MATVATAGYCEAILTTLSQISGGVINRPVTPIGFMQALRDPENIRGVDIIQDAGGENGHLKTVRIFYKQRAVPSEMKDTKDCNTVPEKPRFEDTKTITMEKHHTIAVKEETLRKLCDAYSAWQKLPASSAAVDIMAEHVDDLLYDLDPFRRAINEDLVTSYAALVGNFMGGVTTKSYDVIKSTDHSLVAKGFNLMKQDMNRIGLGGTPIVFGEGNMDLAIMSGKYGCCNTAGQDFGQMMSDPGFKFYRDVDAPTILGGENVFGLILPKYAHLMTYNKYVGNFSRPIGEKQRGTMIDPSVPGIRYDFSLEPNTCGEYYDLKIDAYYDLYVAPNDMWKAAVAGPPAHAADRLFGVNGTFKATANAVA